jgi:uncharacterized membrane protein HdeD (DUF308 family)
MNIKWRSVNLMRTAKIGYIVMSIIFIIVGLLFVIHPVDSLMVIEKILGVSMMLFGVIKIIGYFSKDLFRLAFQYDLEFGIILMVLGLVMLIKPVSVMELLVVAIGLAFFSDALFKARIAFDSKGFGIRPWWMILMLAVLTAVIGLVLILSPETTAAAITVLFGLSLMSEGLLNLFVAISTVKIIRNQYPDEIDVTYSEIK